MSVYFLLCPSRRLVKIGFSTDVAQRVAAIRYSDPLGSGSKFLGYIDGDLATEREFHWRFATLRHSREWFRYTQDLKSAIAALPLITAMPELKNCTVPVTIRVPDLQRYRWNAIVKGAGLTLQGVLPEVIDDHLEKLARKQARGAA
jgi:hypothetical protein